MSIGPEIAAKFQKDADRANTLTDLNAAFGACVRAAGFTAHAVGYTPGEAGNGDPFLLLDWPRTWLELYAREGFAAEDAVVAAAATATEPFTWRELQARQPGASARIFAAARDHGWTDGFLVPLRCGSETGRLGVASLAAPALDGLSDEARAHIVAVSESAFRRAVALSAARDHVPLSKRERQALELVACGRGDREIAAALGVTVATAHFHVEKAKKKLGAMTRAQAAAIGVARGAIVVR